jgi:hypothetical protein
MSDPAFTRPDLFSIRAAAEHAGFADAVRGLLSADDYPLAGDDPLAPLARDAARTPVEAGFTLHYRHEYDLLYWHSGVYLMHIPAESGTGHSGIPVSWTTHDLLPNWDWRATYSHTRQLMNAAPDSVLHAFGYLNRQLGTAGTCLVTGHRGQRTEAGR